MKRVDRVFESALGQTLVELMMVVTIISILLLIAVPRMGNLINKSQEGATKANLDVVRTSIRAYYADTEGLYPSDMSAITVSAKYIAAIPVTKLPPHHGDSAQILQGPQGSISTDAGGWAYDNAPGDANYGEVWINCTHTDVRGTVWSAY